MPYANHRIVGAMELEPSSSQNNSIEIGARRSSPSGAATAAVRRIGIDLTEARSAPRLKFEPTVRVNTSVLLRELETEFAGLVARHRLVAFV